MRRAVAVVRDNPPVSTAATRLDVRRQKAIDARRPVHQGVLAARMLGVGDAQEAFARREPDAAYALRQSLIDLASVAELVADELPRPR
jgi:hypothetical protein